MTSGAQIPMTDPMRAALENARVDVQKIYSEHDYWTPSALWVREKLSALLKKIDSALSTPPTPTGAEIDLIELCAKVADTYAKAYPDQHDTHNVAKAIRTLKARHLPRPDIDAETKP